MQKNLLPNGVDSSTETRPFFKLADDIFFIAPFTVNQHKCWPNVCFGTPITGQILCVERAYSGILGDACNDQKIDLETVLPFDELDALRRSRRDNLGQIKV